MVMRVKVGRQGHHDRATETAVDVIGDNSLQNGSLKDPVQPAYVGIKVVGRQRGVLSICLHWRIIRLGCRGASNISCGWARRSSHSDGSGRPTRTLKVNRQSVTIHGVLLLFLFGKL